MTNLLEKNKIQAIRKNSKVLLKSNLGMELIQKLAEEFIINDMTIASISEKYNVSFKSVQMLSANGKWLNKRLSFRERVVKDTMKKCEMRFKRIAGNIAEVFHKQSEYINRRLKLIKEGEPVPKDLMKEALKLHDIVSKDLMKVKDVNSKMLPSKILAEASGMPSVIDMINYEIKPTTKPPEIEVESSVIDSKEEDKSDKEEEEDGSNTVQD